MRRTQLGHMDLSGIFWIGLAIAGILLIGGSVLFWASMGLWFGRWFAPNPWLGGFVFAVGVCLIVGGIWLAVFFAPIFR